MTLIGKFELRVQDSEIDELGHVNNARFLEYFERARMDWYNRCDPSLNDMTGKSLGTVVVNIDVNYRQECFPGARLVIETRPGTRGRKSYTLHQAIFNDDGARVCDARVTSVVMDMSTRKTIPLPPSLAEHFGEREQPENS